MPHLSFCPMRANTIVPCPDAIRSSVTQHLKNTVFVSLENPDGNYCVDVFIRPDGTFGFEEYRRDAEDCGVWQSMHRYSRLVFASQENAIEQARENVAWLKARGI